MEALAFALEVVFGYFMVVWLVLGAMGGRR